MAEKTGQKRVAIAGLGPIGIKVMQALDAGIGGLTLAAVAVGNPAKVRPELERLSPRPSILPLDRLEPAADMVIECAPAAALRSIVQPFVAAGKTAVVLSAGALLEQWDLVEVARQSGGQIVVPTGALIGLDAVTAAAEGVIHSVRMVTRKPVAGLIGAPYLVKNGIDIAGLREPRKVFDGPAGEGARGCSVARRHRPRPHDARDLGRPCARPQHPPHRGRSRLGELHDVHCQRAER
jgi:aspartate dehydrogenase